VVIFWLDKSFSFMILRIRIPGLERGEGVDEDLTAVLVSLWIHKADGFEFGTYITTDKEGNGPLGHG
jgi:hypothetical protein